MKTKSESVTLPMESVVRTAAVVGLILLIPVFGNIFMGGWNWGPMDFVVIGAMLFVAGLAIEFAINKIANPTYRWLAVLAIVAAFLALWAELAVDAVSQVLLYI